VPMRLTPIRRTTGPVTNGGKAFFSALGGIKLRPISSNAQTHAVPRIAPYPSGQGNLFPEASVGQVPFAYHCANAPVATGMVAKDVPTTLPSDGSRNCAPNETSAKVIWSFVKVKASDLNGR
jgi:hypothetical protein